MKYVFNKMNKKSDLDSYPALPFLILSYKKIISTFGVKN